MNFASHNNNLFEVIELEKFEIGEERIGPEVHGDNEEEIKIHSAFHNHLFLLLEFQMVDNIKADEIL